MEKIRFSGGIIGKSENSGGNRKKITGYLKNKKANKFWRKIKWLEEIVL